MSGSGRFLSSYLLGQVLDDISTIRDGVFDIYDEEPTIYEEMAEEWIVDTSSIVDCTNENTRWQELKLLIYLFYHFTSFFEMHLK